MHSNLRRPLRSAGATNFMSFKFSSGPMSGLCPKLLVAMVILMVAGGAGAPAFAQEQEPPAVPVIRGDLGPCTADFTVTDAEGKPLFDAKIHVLIRYGFLGKRKSELEVGTNSDGKARFEGLPNRAKKPLEFRVRSGDMIQLLVHDPEADCNPSFSVKLEKP